MNTIDFELLISKFDSIAFEAKTELSMVLSIISEGKVPSKEDVEKIDANIECLNGVYNSIVEASKTLLPEADIPERNSSVNAYASAVRENVMKIKVQYAKQVIEDFLHVQSLVESYTIAINPYQEKAQELLDVLLNTDVSNIESTIEDIKPTELFLKALRCEDIDSDEGIAILEEVSEFFSRRVQLGIQGKKYFISDKHMAFPVVVEYPRTDNGMGSSKDEVTVAIDVEAEDSSVSNDDLDLLGNDNLNIDNCGDNKNEKNAEEDLKRECSEGGISEEMLYSIKKTKNSTPSAAAFKNEILSMPNNARDILPLFTNVAVMTAEQVHLIGFCMDCFGDSKDALESVKHTLSLLTNKGLLVAYDLGEKMGLAYCLTSYCNACLKKESISKLRLPKSGRRFWNISFGEYRVCGTDEISKQLITTALEETDALLKYVYDIKKHISIDICLV